MKQFIIALSVLIVPFAGLAESDTPVVEVSCFRNTDARLVCQIKKKTYMLAEFLQELPKLSAAGSTRSTIRFTVALDFPSGALLNMLSAAQDADFSKLEVMTPSSLPSELISKLPRKEVKVQLLELYRRPKDKSEQTPAGDVLKAAPEE